MAAPLDGRGSARRVGPPDNLPELPRTGSCPAVRGAHRTSHSRQGATVPPRGMPGLAGQPQVRLSHLRCPVGPARRARGVERAACFNLQLLSRLLPLQQALCAPAMAGDLRAVGQVVLISMARSRLLGLMPLDPRSPRYGGTGCRGGASSRGLGSRRTRAVPGSAAGGQRLVRRPRTAVSGSSSSSCVAATSPPGAPPPTAAAPTQRAAPAPRKVATQAQSVVTVDGEVEPLRRSVAPRGERLSSTTTG